MTQRIHRSVRALLLGVLFSGVAEVGVVSIAFAQPPADPVDSVSSLPRSPDETVE